MTIAMHPARMGSMMAIALAATAMMPMLAAPTQAQSAVATLAGSWGGSGRITYTDGSSEGIHCTAYYSGGGSELRMAIQCKSDKNPIHIRSRLKIDGARASGEWEERTFNASGSATGSVGASNMNLTIGGGGFNGTMNVTFAKSSHSITVSTQGIAMSRATMSFTRN